MEKKQTNEKCQSEIVFLLKSGTKKMLEGLMHGLIQSQPSDPLEYIQAYFEERSTDQIDKAKEIIRNTSIHHPIFSYHIFTAYQTLSNNDDDNCDSDDDDVKVTCINGVVMECFVRNIMHFFHPIVCKIFSTRYSSLSSDHTTLTRFRAILTSLYTLQDVYTTARKMYDENINKNNYNNNNDDGNNKTILSSKDLLERVRTSVNKSNSTDFESLLEAFNYTSSLNKNNIKSLNINNNINKENETGPNNRKNDINNKNNKSLEGDEFVDSVLKIILEDFGV